MLFHFLWLRGVLLSLPSFWQIARCSSYIALYVRATSTCARCAISKCCQPHCLLDLLPSGEVAWGKSRQLQQLSPTWQSLLQLLELSSTKHTNTSATTMETSQQAPGIKWRSADKQSRGSRDSLRSKTAKNNNPVRSERTAVKWSSAGVCLLLNQEMERWTVTNFFCSVLLFSHQTMPQHDSAALFHHYHQYQHRLDTASSSS